MNNQSQWDLYQEHMETRRRELQSKNPNELETCIWYQSMLDQKDKQKDHLNKCKPCKPEYYALCEYYRGKGK